jgi:uncharacterized protein YukE
MFSNSEMLAASAEIRAIAATMTSSMRELGTPSTWSGSDAEQFENQWNDLVVARLMAAANKLDGLTWAELKDALDG